MDRNWVAVIMVGVVSLGLIVNGFFSALRGQVLFSPGSEPSMGYVVFLGALTLVVVLVIGLIFNRKGARSKKIRR